MTNGCIVLPIYLACAADIITKIKVMHACQPTYMYMYTVVVKNNNKNTDPNICHSDAKVKYNMHMGINSIDGKHYPALATHRFSK